MKILSIETSCDESAVSIVEAIGELESPTFKVLGNALFSQANIHKEYGGVFPMLAKREHAKNLPVLLENVLKQAEMYIGVDLPNKQIDWEKVAVITQREIGLFEGLKKVLENTRKPDIDVVSVTSGPGLAPALWVGISCAKALSGIWGVPVVGTNHMEGHIASVLIENSRDGKVLFPALALLISGGHTELVKIDGWGKYKILGQTLDDAVGEAFDKTARMLGLSYPGGPEVSRLAEKARNEGVPKEAKFTRPMLHADNLNFSFSGLKTAVLYYIRDITDNGKIELTEKEKEDIAREFEDTVRDVLVLKTRKAMEEDNFKTLIVAGGVISNQKIAEDFNKFEEDYDELTVKIPPRSLATDNSLMISAATYINLCLYPELLNEHNEIIAEGNLSLEI